MNLEGLNVVVSANINEFNSRMGEVSNRLGGLGKVAGTAGKVAGVAIGALSTALVALKGAIGVVGVEYLATQEQSAVAWKTLLGTQGEAQDMMKRISDFAKSTPFETNDVDMMAKYMHNAGLEGQGLFDALMSISDVASAFAIPASEAKEMTRQMSQVRQAGVAYTEDLNILQDRGVPIYKAIADQLHINVADVKKMASEGKLSSDIYIKAFQSIADGVKGASDAQSKTFNGMISTMKDNLQILAGALAQPLFDGLKKGMATLMPILEGLTAWAKGDFKGFQDTITKAFGAEMGGKIIGFATAVANAITTVKGWLDKGVQIVSAFYNAFMSVWYDTGEVPDVLAKIGIDEQKAGQVKAFFEGVIKAFQNAVGIIGGVIDVIKAYFSALVEFWRGVFSGDGNVGESFIRIFNVIKSVALPILEQIKTFIQDKLAQIKQFWDENGAQIIQAVKNAWSVIASIIEFLAPVIMFIVQFLWDTVKGIIDGALNVIMGLIKIFAGLFTGDWGKMWEGIKQLLSGAIELIWNLINVMFLGEIMGAIKAFGKGALTFFKEFGPKLVEFFKNMWDDIWKGVQKWVDDIKTLWDILRAYGDTVFQALKTILKNIWDGIVNGIKTAVQGMKDTVINIFNGLKATGEGIFNGAKQIFTSIWTGIKTTVTNVVTTLKDTVLNIFNIIKGGGSIWEKLKAIISEIVNAIKSVVGDTFNGMWNTVKGIFNGIKTAIETPLNGAKKTVLGIIDAIKGAFAKMQITIPKPKIPSISVSMKKGVMGIPYPDFDVSWHKDGGIFNKASVVGLGEAGPEAIVPLQGHRMKPFAESIAKQMPNGGAGGSGLTVHVANLIVREEADVKRVAQELHGLQQRTLRQGGRG